MYRVTLPLLRRGKPRPRAGMFPDKYRRVPTLLKPQQGGQQYFSGFLVRTANDAAAPPRDHLARRKPPQQQQQQQEAEGAMGSLDDDTATFATRLPQMDADAAIERSTEEQIRAEMAALVQQDGHQTQRGFNERLWYERTRAEMQAEAAAGGDATASAPTSAAASGLPERVLGDDYFQSRYGYSLRKHSQANAGAPQAEAAAVVDYAQLDLWGEMPKYHKDMIFLYLVSRRRNTYAVAYDYEGKRLLNTYTAGNRGLKGGDRGFRGDGSTDNGHQVASMYLNDLLPRIREMRASAGRPLQKGEKVDVVVRVMGFYNGRQGAVRAVQDRSSEFTVRYLEDITPFPLNGPKMPRGVFR